MYNKLIIISTIFLLIASKLIGNYSDSLSYDQLYDSARYFYLNGNVEKASTITSNIIKNRRRISDSTIVTKAYNLLGVIHKNIGNLDDALSNYEKALLFSNDNILSSYILMNIANILRRKGDNQRAIIYYKKALEISELRRDPTLEISLLSNLSITYYRSGRLNESLSTILESIEIAERNHIKDIGIEYNACAITYQSLGNLKEAHKYFHKSKNSFEKIYGKNHYKTAISKNNLAGHFLLEGNLIESLELSKSAYKIIFKKLGFKHPYTSDCLKTLGDIYFEKTDYKRALNYYQKALNSRIKSFNDTSIYTNPKVYQNTDLDFLDILKNKAAAFEEISFIEQKEINLNASLSAILTACDFIEEMRIGYLSEISKLRLTSNEHDIYLAGLRFATQLYRLTGNSKYLGFVFDFSEREKYGILRELTKESEARGYAGIPDSLSHRERLLSEELTGCQAFIDEENRHENPDLIYISRLNDKVFELTRKQEQLIGYFEENYPDYYRLKYSNNIVSIKSLQDYLNSSQGLIEYALQDSLINIFLVTKDTFLLTIQEADTKFYDKLKYYTDFLLKDYSLPYPTYNSAAYELYRKLIYPVEKYLTGTELIIVPDKSLSRITFDAFLTSPEKGNPMNMYRDENYLIKKYSIGYAFSATQLVNSTTGKFPLWKNFIGFAPDYSSSPDSLQNIPDAINSLMKIKRLFFGKAIIGKKATESSFKKNSNYRIIHLFVHGIEDTLNPSLSRIYFSQENNTSEDSYLHSYEISNMAVNCNLVSIISCYAGSGVLSKGEGVLSIGRSFANTGVPSIILSNWIMSSGTAAIIMKYYYKNLLMGYDKSTSLKKAKLKYLKHVSPIDADPKVWSGLVLIGNNDPLFKGYILKMILLLTIISGLLMIIIQCRKKLF